MIGHDPRDSGSEDASADTLHSDPVMAAQPIRSRAVPNDAVRQHATHDKDPQPQPEEFGGREGPDPTRYGDWEKNGRCIDF